ncbi:MAG: porin, partial [Kangiellaceae bacterium]
MKTKAIALAVAGILSTPNLYAAEPSNQELLDILKKQQSQIEALQEQLKKTDEKVKESDQKIESSVTAIEENLGTSSTKMPSIGGYGELHYNNIEDSESIDFHRFVLFFGHEFTDSIRFFSELELEHSLAGDGKPGEVELEQAYIEMDLS